MTEPFELQTNLGGSVAVYSEMGFSEKTQAQRMREEQTYLQVQIAKGGVCAKCGRPDMLSLDHIVPDSLLKQFGIDIKRTFWAENIQILCRPCNSFKGNQLDFSVKSTTSLLKKLIEKVDEGRN